MFGQTKIFIALDHLLLNGPNVYQVDTFLLHRETNSIEHHVGTIFY